MENAFPVRFHQFVMLSSICAVIYFLLKQQERFPPVNTVGVNLDNQQLNKSFIINVSLSRAHFMTVLFWTLRLLSTMNLSQANWFPLYCFHRHRIKNGYFLPHDAVLQLRRASHLRARPQDLLPVRFQEVTRWSDKLPLESAPKTCGGVQCSREVRHYSNSLNTQRLTFT